MGWGKWIHLNNLKKGKIEHHLQCAKGTGAGHTAVSSAFYKKTLSDESVIWRVARCWELKSLLYFDVCRREDKESSAQHFQPCRSAHELEDVRAERLQIHGHWTTHIHLSLTPTESCSDLQRWRYIYKVECNIDVHVYNHVILDSRGNGHCNECMLSLQCTRAP